jgi:signal transduction histidine kinase
MNPFRSLWGKLLLGFLLVAVVAVGVVGILANRTTERQFQLYLSQGRQMRASQLAAQFGSYYADAGSWANVADWMSNQQPSPAGGQVSGRGMGRAGQTPADRLLLLAPDGKVLADSQNQLLGEKLAEIEIGLGTPIVVHGQHVGTLLIVTEDATRQSLEAEFLRQVNRSLLWAGVAAGGVALVLSAALAWQLTAPLRQLTAAAHNMAEGQVAEVHIRSRDEIGQLGEAFDHMTRSLARQEKLRRHLMADIAHELRTPLSVMRGDLEALLDGVIKPTPGALASLQEEVLMLTRLVDDLRALALAEAGQLRLERRPTDLVELLRGVIDSFDLQAESQGQCLSLLLSPERPHGNSSTGFWSLVDIDAQRVRQVVANLLSNALHHAPAPESCVTVAAIWREDDVQISVADMGGGIAPEDLPHVFDRFWRAGQARARGIGLGLAIARELVRAHGGRIWAESQPGKGSVFHFTLPLSKEQTATGSGRRDASGQDQRTLQVPS